MTTAYQIFNLPKATQIDSSVRVVPGAKASFFVSGTSTPQDTFTDAALTIPSTNPVVADANGVFAQIFLNPSLVYKLTLTTAADVLIYTSDPCNDQILSQLSIGLLLYPRTAAEIAVSVTPTNYYIPSHSSIGKVLMQRYGWVSSTITDQTTILANALLVARSCGAPLEIPSGTTRYTPPVIFDKACGVIGESRETSILLADGAGMAVKIDIDGEQAEFRGFTVSRQSGAGNGIEQWNGGRVRVRDVIIQNQTGIGLLLRGGNLGSYTDIKTISNTSDGVKIDSGSGYGDSCWDCKFSNLDSRNNGGLGFNLNAGQSHVGDITTQNNTGGGVRINTNNNDLRVYSEANTTWDIFLEPGVVGNIVNNRNADSAAKVAYRANNLILDGAVYRAVIASTVIAPPTIGNVAGNSIVQRAGDAGAGASPFVGGDHSIQAGDAGGTGNASGGAVKLKGGRKLGTGGNGTVNIELSSLQLARTGITYSASMTPDATVGNIQAIRANSGVAFTINAPTNPQEAIPLTITIVNISGGALGAVTWNAIYKMSAWTQPANGFSRSITFYYDGTNWIQKDQTGVDVPN